MHIKLIHKKIQLFHYQKQDFHIQKEFPLGSTFTDTSHSYAVVRASDLSDTSWQSTFSNYTFSVTSVIKSNINLILNDVFVFHSLLRHTRIEDSLVQHSRHRFNITNRIRKKLHKKKVSLPIPISCISVVYVLYKNWAVDLQSQWTSLLKTTSAPII